MLIFNGKAYFFEEWKRRRTKENEIHFIEPRFRYLETVLIGQLLFVFYDFPLFAGCYPVFEFPVFDNSFQRYLQLKN